MARDVRGRRQLVAFSCHDTSKRSQQTTHLLFDHDSIGGSIGGNGMYSNSQT